ncbi:ATP-dependent helicase/nuclease subunit A [bioreactor metagenome]|uniref:DNA 3'-5' helicase n=1 Tax=bioreactor metagenome TaxID=1076179 RepID=A0A644SUZ4_9ZZZZ|nr:helicase-exonuclease AddAB subunit AddA [Negativicutes bacterium]
MSWSDKQMEAITARRQNVLVAAAAGSGKTSVLVERIIQRITDDNDPLDVDKLLVVTFTNAAAAEMRARIGAAIAEALKQQQGSRHLERQLVLLNSSSISTIHSFCQTTVRQNFHILDLDPKFRVAGEAECALLKNDVLQDMFEEFYTNGDAGFLQFVEHYGDDHSDEPLYNLILGLYNFSRSHPWPDYWLRSLKDAFALEPDATIEATPWSELIRDKVIIELEQVRQEVEALMIEAMRPGNPDAYAGVFESDLVIIDEVIAAAQETWNKAETALTNVVYTKLPAIKGIDDDVKKYFQTGRDHFKKKIKKFRDEYFNRPAEDLLADLQKAAPLVEALAELTIAFGEHYAAMKKDKALVDFNDLEHFCLRVLCHSEAKPGEIRPSAAAQALQDKYAEIMIDEYQDTNGVQETILRLIARPNEPNLFMVGDVKQSIYRFRLAEPELFIQKYLEYPLGDGENCRRIDLAQNFRSRAGILHAVNFLFTQLMAPRVAELSYGEAEKLNPGPDYPACDGSTTAGPVELCLIDADSEQEKIGAEEAQEPQDEVSSSNNGEFAVEEELTGFELEARLIGKKITSLMSDGSQVFDKHSKGYRRLEWRDIVILLRSTKGKAGVLLETLRQVGIPVYAEVDSGYFREIEVQVMLSLLSVIDNPRQDIHLAGILRSPIVGLSAAQLAEMRLANKDGDLWSALTALEVAVENPLTAAVGHFISQLNQWRALSRRKGVPQLIWQIYRDTGYYDYVGGMPGGTLRQANLRALYDRARQYEATNFRGLFRFLRFIDQLKDKGSDLAVARALGESENVVRVMSIHKSKGLEFPVVFVADLGKNFNLQDSNGLVLCHKILGVGPYVTNPDLRYRYPTIARRAIAFKMEMETKAEELRILYVALTRAREKLILVGSVKKLAKRVPKWCRTVGLVKPLLPESLIAGAKSYLDWICPAVARHEQGRVLREFAESQDRPGSLLANDASEWEITIWQRQDLTITDENINVETPLMTAVQKLEPVPEGSGTEWVEKLLGWQYTYSSAVGKPAKLSVTEIKRRFELENFEDAHKLFERPPIVSRPRFVQSSGKLSAAEHGTLVHYFMQHIDLTGDVSEEGLARQREEMVRRELLLPDQAEGIDLKAAAAFFAAGLGRRLLASPCVRRELPFSLTLPAERFYRDLAVKDEGVFVQGVIDVLFDDPAGLILVDYKTDRAAEAAALAEKYAVQLNLYAEAVGMILRRPVAEKYLYLFSSGQVARII